MPDFAGGISADEVRELLAAAGEHLADAGSFLAARGEGRSIGTPAEDVAIMLAQAQAKATVAIAGQLANGVNLSPQAQKDIQDFIEAVATIVAMKREAGG
jgi:alkanesulfonate monooxygenase SsuD/methylene tetrahydromethanopterin reductase-like flavin-dependent oxidoreductase (luciferase family)